MRVCRFTAIVVRFECVTWLVPAVLALHVSGCRGDGDGGGAGASGGGGGDNRSCEAGCTEDYARDLTGCGAEASTCMASCADLDDVDCLWDCEDVEFECSTDFTLCAAGCPCLEVSQSCILDCDLDDMGCLTACANEYLDCAGADAPYNCVTTCDALKTDCAWDCEDTAADIAEYVVCRDTCVADQVTCVEACG